MYHEDVLALLLAVAMTMVPVERVVAVVNGVPVLETDVRLAEIARLVPPLKGEDEAAHRRAVADALVDLELRWQDLSSAAIAQRTPVDMERVWAAAQTRAGGKEALERALSDAGLDAGMLRHLLEKAAVVQAYVATRFEPFIRPTQAEVESLWRTKLLPELKAAGKPIPPLDKVRDTVEALVRENKLQSEVDRWTEELARRAEIVRYYS